MPVEQNDGARRAIFAFRVTLFMNVRSSSVLSLHSFTYSFLFVLYSRFFSGSRTSVEHAGTIVDCASSFRCYGVKCNRSHTLDRPVFVGGGDFVFCDSNIPVGGTFPSGEMYQ